MDSSYGDAQRRNTEKIQRFQNKVLGSIVSTPKYVKVTDFHRDLTIEMVTDIIKKHVHTRDDLSNISMKRRPDS